MSEIKKVVKRTPLIGDILLRIYNFFRHRSFKGSTLYWEERYSKGGTSGPGSYEVSGKYKAEILNKFVEEKKISTVIEFGCGDGNQLLLSNYNSYIGLDVSVTAIKKCIEVFKNDKSKSFYQYNSFAFQDNHQLFSSDLSLSLDVIYHVVEDDIFDKYMTHLFNSSKQYVIIYAWDVEGKQRNHIKHRKFTNWIQKHQTNWSLIDKISNSLNEGSASDFYIFKKLQ